MAVTFRQQPQHFTPSDNPIMFVFDSNATNLPDFEFLIEVYAWQGSIPTSQKLSTHRIFPTLGNQAYFDASETISAYLQAPTLPDDTQLIIDAGNWDEFVIVVNEVSGSIVLPVVGGLSNIFTSWKASLSDEQFMHFDADDYTVRSAITDDSIKWLTNLRVFDEALQIFGEQNYGMVYYDGTGIFNLEFFNFDANFNLVDDVFYNPNITAKGVYIINLRPETIASVTGLDITNVFFLTADIPAKTISFDIFLKISYNKISESFMPPNIIRNCYPLPRKNQIFYLNKLGGIDSFFFPQRFEKRKQTQRNGLERPFGRHFANQYVFKNYPRRTQHLNTTTFQETLQTNWLDEFMHNLLIDELIESPLVFRYDDNGNKYFLLITDNSSQYRFDDFETLYQLNLNVEQSLTSKSARL